MTEYWQETQVKIRISRLELLLRGGPVTGRRGAAGGAARGYRATAGYGSPRPAEEGTALSALPPYAASAVPAHHGGRNGVSR